MSYECMLKHRPKMNPPAPCLPGPNCKTCGWEAAEAKRRRELIEKNGLTTGEYGMRHLVVSAV